MDSFGAYLGLFVASVLEAAPFPVRSELVLLALLATEQAPWLPLVILASIGNTLGAVVNWLLGRFITRFEDRRWFPARRDQIARAEAWYHRYGRWSLLLSWLPVAGDLLTIAAGVMRERLLPFLALVGIAKTARYFAVVGIFSGWL